MPLRWADVSRAWWLLPIAAVGLLLFWTSRITGSPIVSDSVATLQMAENLAHHGVLSIDEGPPFEPSMYREPLPALVTAALVKVVDSLHGEAPQSAYLQGDRAWLLKLQNLFWFALLAWCVMSAVRYWTGSVLAGILAAIVAQACYFYPAIRPYGIDSLFSDVPAAAVLAAASLVVGRAIHRLNWPMALAAGLLLGAFTLIKAAGLYVFGGLVLLLLLVGLVQGRRLGYSRCMAVIAAMIVGFVILVSPWMVRNHQLFDTWSISDRGGLSLYTRMLKDQMTDAEYRGAFYAWTPGKLQVLVGRVMGYGPDDLKPGGRLQHFKHAADGTELYTRERAAEREGREADALAWYYQGRAARVREYLRASEQKLPHPWLAADQELQRQALGWIRAHPAQHLKLTFPYLWRAALVIFPALCMGLIWALWRRDEEMLWYGMPAFGLILFYAMFANFEERYGIPALPVAVASGIIVVCRVWQLLRGSKA